MPESWELRPVQNEQGQWDALDEEGYGHSLGFPSEVEVERWIQGYDVGARENM